MNQKAAIAFHAFCDHLSLHGKCSILISCVLFTTVQNFLPLLLFFFLFSKTFPGLEINFSCAKFSRFSSVGGNTVLCPL